MGLLPTVASTVIISTLLTTLQVKDIPYTVALTPASLQRQEQIVQMGSTLTQSPYQAKLSPFRNTGDTIVLGDGGTRLFLQPRLSAQIRELPAAAVQRAELHIPVHQRSSSSKAGSVVFGAYQVLNSWSPAGTAGFTPPSSATSPLATTALFYDALGVPVQRSMGVSGSNNSTSTSGVNAATTVSGSTQTLSFDVTSLVRQWLAGTPNHGILIRELDPGETTGIWWDTARGAQPELLVTVYQDYLPREQPTPPVYHGGGHEPYPNPPPEPGVDDTPMVPVVWQPWKASLDLGAALFSEASSVVVGQGNVETIDVGGIRAEAILRLDAFELELTGSAGEGDKKVNASGETGSGDSTATFSMMGSIKRPLGGNVFITPGFGLSVNERTAASSNSTEKLRRTNTFSGMVLASELSWEPSRTTDLGLRLAVVPGAVNESYRWSQGSSWREEAALGIFTQVLEGQLSAKAALNEHLVLSAGYKATASFASAQEVEFLYTDSTGNSIPGRTTTQQTTGLSQGWYLGAAYRF